MQIIMFLVCGGLTGAALTVHGHRSLHAATDTGQAANARTVRDAGRGIIIATIVLSVLAVAT